MSPEKRKFVVLRPSSLGKEGGNRFDGLSNAMSQADISTPCFTATGAVELNAVCAYIHISNI